MFISKNYLSNFGLVHFNMFVRQFIDLSSYKKPTYNLLFGAFNKQLTSI